jgi:DNA topoisomerase-1
MITDADGSERTVLAQQASAVEAGLLYVSDTQPGIRRTGSLPKFEYTNSDGSNVHDAATLERIRLLVIPPAYVEVWICPSPRGHIQATGRDARGRKQYRYHARWRQVRDGGKFERVASFAQALPVLRRAVRRDFKLPGLPREKVLATVVALLAHTLIRVGNEEYAKGNRSFGLTTLRNRHIARSKGRLAFRFRGKSGKEHDIAIGDERLARIVRRCQQLPGQNLFQYTDENGAAHPLDSGMVNDYLRETMRDDFTAKDFRTWGGTLAAMSVLARMPLPEQGDDVAARERSMAQLENAAVAEVAALLGNTVAVCRKSYIHPDVFAAWRDGSLARAIPQDGSLRRLESRALTFLKRRTRKQRRLDR